MKKKNNVVVPQERPIDSEVERILNQDDEDLLVGFDVEDKFELSFESAMEP